MAALPPIITENPDTVLARLPAPSVPRPTSNRAGSWQHQISRSSLANTLTPTESPTMDAIVRALQKPRRGGFVFSTRTDFEPVSWGERRMPRRLDEKSFKVVSIIRDGFQDRHGVHRAETFTAIPRHLRTPGDGLGPGSWNEATQRAQLGEVFWTSGIAAGHHPARCMSVPARGPQTTLEAICGDVEARIREAVEQNPSARDVTGITVGAGHRGSMVATFTVHDIFGSEVPSPVLTVCYC